MISFEKNLTVNKRSILEYKKHEMEYGWPSSFVNKIYFKMVHFFFTRLHLLYLLLEV